MPESRFVRSSQLKPLLGYLLVMVIGLLVADALVQRFANDPGARMMVALGWLLFLPFGSWRIWKRG